ncbi:MAG: M14 family metallocarboxypeptidase [Clostridia bacterium]|nr:M14 family metallocarboxypeptidase [Clostridia bacterium]
MERIVLAEEYDYYERQKVIENLCREYPFIKKVTIGKSCLGKEIEAIKIGNSNSYSLISAAFHGSERITSNVLLMFIEELANAIKTDGYIAGFKARRALSGRGVIFVPCVNPDGCDIALLGEKACGNNADFLKKIAKNNFSNWNSNFRGVDINHNFDADWENLRKKERALGINGPSPTRFGGTKPESEPETIALTKLCRTANIRHVAALHSQGEVIYWSFGKTEHPKSRKMAEIMATSSGYALDIPTGISDGGGFKDWFIEEFKRPGFTIEIGKGQNPLPIKNAIPIYTKIKEMLMLCAIM